MELLADRIRCHVLAGIVLVLSASGCGPTLPDDLPTLIQLMNHDSETTSVEATNKVWHRYGSAGLLQAIREGKPTARARGPYRLKEFSGATTEEALIRIVNDDPDALVKVQALTSSKTEDLENQSWNSERVCSAVSASSALIVVVRSG